MPPWGGARLPARPSLLTLCSRCVPRLSDCRIYCYLNPPPSVVNFNPAAHNVPSRTRKHPCL